MSPISKMSTGGIREICPLPGIQINFSPEGTRIDANDLLESLLAVADELNPPIPALDAEP